MLCVYNVNVCVQFYLSPCAMSDFGRTGVKIWHPWCVGPKALGQSNTSLIRFVTDAYNLESGLITDDPFRPKVSHIGTKLDKTEIFQYQISVHFSWTLKSVLYCDLEKSRICPIWGQSQSPHFAPTPDNPAAASLVGALQSYSNIQEDNGGCAVTCVGVCEQQYRDHVRRSWCGRPSLVSDDVRGFSRHTQPHKHVMHRDSNTEIPTPW